MENITASIFKYGHLFSRWISQQYFPELKHLLILAWPIVLMNLCRFLNPVISMIICGHLSKTEFDAAALANALINVFGVSVDLGFSTACDTLFAQIYGSKHKRKLGLMLQRAFLVMTILFLLLACFHLNIEPILIWLSQDVEISRLTAKYVTLFLPGLFFDFHFLTIARYLQNQNIVYPLMISSMFSCVYNAIVQYVAIYVYGYGIEASAISQASACFVMFSIQLAYVLISRIYKSTWQGFEFSNALEGWGIFFKLGIPGIVMIGVEEWTFEIGNFISGAMGDVQLGAQSVVFQTGLICYMIHTGFAIAVAIRTGHHLGANMPNEASLTAKVTLFTEVIIAVTLSAIVFFLRGFIPYIFTNDEEIRALAEKIFIILAIIQIMDAGCSSASALFRSCGKQLQGAIVMITTYYLIGVPLGLILIFVVKTDIRGFWWGLTVAILVEVTVFLIIIYKINWFDEAVKAQLRVKESRVSESGMEKDLFLSENENLIEADECSKVEITTVIGHGLGHMRSMSGVTDKLALTMTEDLSKLISNKRIEKTTIVKRLIFIGITLILFIGSILMKIYLPRGYYIPCINLESNETTSPLNKHYPFCNDTIYKF